jgi:hypothetical protein
MRERGWETEHSDDIRPDANTVLTVERQSASASHNWTFWAGVGLSSRNPEVFEAVINVFHRGAPGAKIALIAAQDEIPEAAARGLPS